MRILLLFISSLILPLKAQEISTDSIIAQEIPPGQQAPSSKETSSFMTTESYENAFIKMLLTLGALFILIFFTIWLFRRFSLGRFNLSSSKTIKVLERRPLSPKSMLYLIEVENKRILISESQLEVRTLSPVENIEKISQD